MHTKEKAVAEAVDAYEHLQEVRATIRRTPAKLRAFDQKNILIIHAYQSRGVVKKDKSYELQNK